MSELSGMLRSLSERSDKLLEDLQKVGEFDVHGPFILALAEILSDVVDELVRLDRRAEAEAAVDNIEELPPEPKEEPKLKRFRRGRGG